MDRREELEQQIWEFVYGLLPDDEADALRRQLADDAEAARLYDEIRRRAGMLAQAAKLELPPIALVPPQVGRRSSRRRWVNAAVALAASLLLCFLGYAGFCTRALERSLATAPAEPSWAEPPVRTVVYGPATLQPALANHFAVQTQSVDGVPRAAAVDYRVIGEDGTLLTSGRVQSDASGFAQFNYQPSAAEGDLRSPPFRNVQLELEPQLALPGVPVRRTLPLAARALTTYLSADKTVYRPGETLRCRSLTLDRATLQMLREVPVEFLILDAAGQPLRGARQEVLSQHGVAFADFALPRFQPAQPAGRYTLVARSPTDAFPEARREFELRAYATPTLRQQLDFARDSYEAGAEVEAQLNVKTPGDGPARGVPLAVRAEAGGRTFLNLHTTTDDQGTYRIRFRLPEELALEDAVLNVTAGNEVKNRLSEAIPVQQGTARVEFFPESGELVADVSNRVYFFVHDARDKPLAIRGRLVDGQGRQLAAIETMHDGRGRFVFQPTRGESYQLELDTAAGPGGSFPLPPISDQQFLVLDAAPGVFPAGAPLTVRLRTNSVRPVAVSAVCRGVVVGQELVSPAVFEQSREAAGPELVLPLAETAEGVIRLTAYDYSTQPPTPVAERLVFRRPARKLAIRPQQETGPVPAGTTVELAFSVQDERDRPLAAVLGAAVVDEAALSLARDRCASLTTHFWLTGQLEDLRGLEDANIYLAEGSQAAQALDLLLGTQGWRRFVRWPADQLAYASPAEQTLQPGQSAGELAAVVPVAEPAAPAVLADTVTQTADAVRSSVNSLYTSYAQTVQRAGRVLVVGSLILVLILGLLAVIRRLPALTVSLSALATSALCLLLGGIWLAGGVKPQQPSAKVSVAQAAGEVQLAQVDEGLARGPAADSAELPASQAADQPPRGGWFGMENRLDKDGRLAGDASVLHDAAPPREDTAGTASNESVPLQAARQRKQRADANVDRFGTSNLQTSDPERLLLRQGKKQELAEPVEEPQRDKSESAESRTSLADEASPERKLFEDRGQPAAPRASPPAASQPSGPAGLGGPARRLNGAAPSVPRPEPLAAPQAEPRLAAEAAPVPAEPLAELPAAAPESPAAPAAARPMSAVAAPSAPAQSVPRAKADSIAALEAEAEEAAPEQLGDALKAEQAPAAMPAIAGRIAQPDGAALYAAPADEMGSMGRMGGMGGGGFPTASAGVPPPVQQMFRQYARQRRSAARDADDVASQETVCWEPLLLTDAQGQATIQFRLPEAAASYRVLIDGHAQGRIGSHLGRLVVQPPSAPQ